MPWGVAVGAIVGGIASNSAAKKQEKSANKAIEAQENQFNMVRGDTAAQREIGGNALNKLADILGVERAGPAAPTREQFTTINGQKKQNLPPGIAGHKIEVAQKLLGKKKKKGPEEYFDEGAYNSAMEKYKQDLDAFNNRARGMDAFTPDPGYQFRLDNTNKTIDRYQSAGRVTGGRAIKEATRYGQDFASNEFGNSIGRLFTLAGYGPVGVNTSSAAGQSTANNISNLNLQAGNAAAQNYANINNQVQGGIQNYQTYKTYNDWQGKLNPSTPSMTTSTPQYDPMAFGGGT